jgi:hypothetical protein
LFFTCPLKYIKQSKMRGEKEMTFPDKDMSIIKFNPVVG